MEIKKQAHIMREKFEKYWDGLMNINPLMIVGSAFVSRKRWSLFLCRNIKCRNICASVTKMLKKVYEEYSIRFRQPDHIDAAEDTSDNGDCRKSVDVIR